MVVPGIVVLVPDTADILEELVGKLAGLVRDTAGLVGSVDSGLGVGIVDRLVHKLASVGVPDEFDEQLLVLYLKVTCSNTNICINYINVTPLLQI